MVDVLMHAERHLGVGAIDRARRRINQMLDAVMTAALEDVQEADQVGIDIGVRIVERVADAGLRGEMQDALRLVFREQPFHRGAILQVGLDEVKAVARRKLVQPRLLQA